MNRKFWLGLITVLVVMGFSAVAFAEGAPDAAAAAVSSKAELGKWLAVAAGFGIAIAAFGGALGQGRAAAAALDGIARNPGASGKLFVPMLLGLAFIESLVIYALIISFMLVGKL